MPGPWLRLNLTKQTLRTFSGLKVGNIGWGWNDGKEGTLDHHRRNPWRSCAGLGGEESLHRSGADQLDEGGHGADEE